MKQDSRQFEISFTSLLELLEETKRKLEEAIATYRQFADDPCDKNLSLPCDACARMSTCTSACAAINSQLPKPYQGRGHRENLVGLYSQTLSNNYERTRRSEIFSEYKKCQIIFSPKQWEVISLYYHEGLSEPQIAKHLGKKPNTISDLLNRARKRIETHRREYREELYKLKGEQRRTFT
jgi:RNA polymerase sigma factor (sigma-70 family)